MPELPDVTVYLEALAPRILGQPLEGVRVRGPSLVRTADPPLREAIGKRVTALRRQGKRLVWVLEDGLFLVLHLMIAGRLHWKPRGAPVPGRVGLAAFDFPEGRWCSPRPARRSARSCGSLRGEEAVAALDRGGIEPMEATLGGRSPPRSAARTTPSSARSPIRGCSAASATPTPTRSSIAARLSPVALTQRLDDDEVAPAARGDPGACSGPGPIGCARRPAADFPEKVTAFREGMAVHGRYRQPCPDVRLAGPAHRPRRQRDQLLRRRCQTGGRLLADRSLSRLLKEDWPRSLEELEETRAATRSRMQGQGPG